MLANPCGTQKPCHLHYPQHPNPARARRIFDHETEGSKLAQLQTFHLPEAVGEAESDVRLAHEMIEAWNRDGIFQVAATPEQDRKTEAALAASQRFCSMTPRDQAEAVSAQHTAR